MKIICATDFSEQGRAAGELAVALARKLGDSVLLVHAVDPAPLSSSEPSTMPADWESAMLKIAAGELATESARLESVGLAMETRALLGHPVETIARLIGEEEPRMLVLGSHGRRGVAHFFVGSVAESLARRAPCPVVVTRGLPYPQDGLFGKGRLKLLVLSDASPAAEAALGWVKDLRRQVACDVTFVQGYRPEAEEERFGLPVRKVDGRREYQPALRPLLEQELRRWVGAVPGEGEVSFRLCALHRSGLEELAMEAELLQPDLVVVGIDQRSFAEGRGMFSATAALKSLKLPVVCVPESLRPPMNGHIPVIRTVVVGTDLSDFANQAIPAAYALVNGLGGRVEICHLFETARAAVPSVPSLPGLTLDPTRKQEIEARLASLIPPEAAGRGIRTAVVVREAATATEGLRQEAERCDADVIVVASHGRQGLSRALMGSVAEDVTRKTTRPVLVLHPPQR